MLEHKWKLKPVAKDKVSRLQNETGWNKELCTLLVARGVFTLSEATLFFRPQYKDLHNPFLLKDMDKATARIEKAISQQEVITVYGDYDVDGTTAVAVVYAFLRRFVSPEVPLYYYIPNRYTEGYGVSLKGIDDAWSRGTTLMIVLDCGIKAVEKVAYAKSKGIDVIVCDHHLPSEDEALPEAFAIINPKQNGCNYPYKELSGCGIGYKLITALAQKWDIVSEKKHNELLDLVAASIASDIVPMTGENRILAYFGLLKANKKPCLAVELLSDLAGRQVLTVMQLVFMIGPRINAAGRMNDANKAVTLFLEKDKPQAAALAAALKVDNEDRRALDQAMTLEALEMLEASNLQEKKSIVLFKPSWHKGVLGIVASRIVERYHKPTVMLTADNGMVTGSARSVPGFDIYKAISNCADLMTSWGGHQFAAGVNMKVSQVDEFTSRLEAVVQDQIAEASLVPVIEIDCELSFRAIDLDFLSTLEQFEPCGPKNPAPIFLTKGVVDSGWSKLVKEKHIQLQVMQSDGVILKGIAFNQSHHFERMHKKEPFAIVYHVERNIWKGKASVNLRVLDIKFEL